MFAGQARAILFKTWSRPPFYWSVNAYCIFDSRWLIPNLTCIPHFLYQLNNARGGWRKKANHFTEGGDFGNREELVNRLIKKMI